jgi:hypothetical protein
MNDNKKVVAAADKHYERRWLEAKSEMIKDAGPVVDFFINMHHQCSSVAEKHKVSTAKLTEWVLEQLPIAAVCESDEEEEDEDEEE